MNDCPDCRRQRIAAWDAAQVERPRWESEFDMTVPLPPPGTVEVQWTTAETQRLVHLGIT